MVHLLWKAVKFSWDEKREEIFQKLKTFLSSPVIIQKLRPDQLIIVYLLVSEEVVNAVLVQEVEKDESQSTSPTRRSTRPRRGSKW